MRVTSEFWVAAYLRTRNAAHKPTVLMRRGAAEAGAIYLRVDRLDGTHDLYQPASQFSYKSEDIEQGKRLFSPCMSAVSTFDIMDKLEAEARFDPDFWVVETECAQGSHDLIIADE